MDDPGRGSWRAAAACRHTDTELFFPVSHRGLAAAGARRAKAICARCPVRLPCLSYALATRQAYGIWGGYDEEERGLLRRQQREPQPPVQALSPCQRPVLPGRQALSLWLHEWAPERGWRR
jgi:WhiB family redox-sensing transcriptional regulator